MKTKFTPIPFATAAFLIGAAAAGAGEVSGQSSTNVDIRDYTTVYCPINLKAPAGAYITGIDVSFKCIHTYSGDLRIYLKADRAGSPGSVLLWNREGGSADNPSGTTTGITAFNDVTVNRTWHLQVSDEMAGDCAYQ
jgi:subtilisin-like proprotein convertase family protein